MTKIDYFLGEKKVNLDKIKNTIDQNIDKLPKKLTLVSIGQYINSLKKISSYLEKREIETKLVNSIHTNLKGQILGCHRIDPGDYLFLGEGKFHLEAFKANQINDHLTSINFDNYLSKNNKNINVYYITELGLNKYSFNIEKSIKKVLKKYTIFLKKKEIGLLVSTKFGQKNTEVFKAKKRLEDRFKKKSFYIIIGDNLNNNSLKDFSYIEYFINTACPRISIDDGSFFERPIMNYQNLIASYEYFKKHS